MEGSQSHTILTSQKSTAKKLKEMQKRVSKTLQECLLNLKLPAKTIRFPSKTTLSSSARRIRRSCMHPTKHSVSNTVEVLRNDDLATLSDADRLRLQNLRSLNFQDGNSTDNDKRVAMNRSNSDDQRSVVYFESPRFLNLPSNLGSSGRFFVPIGSSGSLLETYPRNIPISEDGAGGSNSSLTCRNGGGGGGGGSTGGGTKEEDLAPDDFIVLLRYSKKKYDDFKNSMRGMIEARQCYCGKVDWKFLEELLLCFFNLNDEKSRKYILSAFVDLVILLRENSGRIPRKSQFNSDCKSQSRKQ